MLLTGVIFQRRSALQALRAAHETQGPAQQRSRRVEAAAALRNVTVLDDAQALVLLDDAAMPSLPPLQQQMNDAFGTAMRGLVISARAVLRADDRQAG